MEGKKKIKKVLRVERRDYSGLSAFVETPVPTEREVAGFEKAFGSRARAHEIDSHLSEIYTDKHGNPVDIGSLEVKRRPRRFVRFLRVLLVILILGAAAYYAYIRFFGFDSGSGLQLSIEAPSQVLAGENLTYKISYHNPGRNALSGVRLELQYPDGFVVTATSTAAADGDYGWNVGNLDPGQTGVLSVSGYLLGKAGSDQSLKASATYAPAGYSSQFREEAAAKTTISGLGFEVSLDHGDTAFIGQPNHLSLAIANVTSDLIGDFDVSFSLPAETNIALASSSLASGTSTVGAKISPDGGQSWLISGLASSTSALGLDLDYKIAALVSEPQITVRLEKRLPDGRTAIFWEESFTPELADNDLNLRLSVNGQEGGGTADFGAPLQYVLDYSNKGKKALKDVVLIVYTKGAFFAPGSWTASDKGEVGDGTIVWTKSDSAGLASIEPGQSGQVSFSSKVKDFSSDDLGQATSVSAYAQYGVDGQPPQGDGNKSNTVTSLINSDASLSEQVRYFNDSNQPVGSGPLPPKVGQKTVLRYYWTVKNDIHELDGVRVVSVLPSWMEWDGQASATVGTVTYDQASRQVIWNLGRLPVSFYRADAEFSLGLTPAASDQDKVLVVSAGASLQAKDTETGGDIASQTGAKTTKLEDDNIAAAANSGRVQP